MNRKSWYLISPTMCCNLWHIRRHRTKNKQCWFPFDRQAEKNYNSSNPSPPENFFYSYRFRKKSRKRKASCLYAADILYSILGSDETFSIMEKLWHVLSQIKVNLFFFFWYLVWIFLLTCSWHSIRCHHKKKILLAIFICRDKLQC